MTQLDCKRKWRKNKQKQIQKSKQISLLWMVLICPRKGADSWETSRRFWKCCRVSSCERGASGRFPAHKAVWASSRRWPNTRPGPGSFRRRKKKKKCRLGSFWCARRGWRQASFSSILLKTWRQGWLCRGWEFWIPLWSMARDYSNKIKMMRTKAPSKLFREQRE